MVTSTGTVVHAEPVGEGAVMLVPMGDIRPAPENDALYRPVLDSDPEIRALAESIWEHGLREPLAVSSDGFILSGHRRFAAARLAGLKEVSVRVEDVSREHEPERFLTLLREHNRQRVKSLDEQIREAVIDADPDECRAELQAHRRRRSRVSHMNDFRSARLGAGSGSRPRRRRSRRRSSLSSTGCATSGP